MMLRCAGIALTLSLLATSARASLITFETTPTGATPVDNAVLVTPYTVTGGTVHFFFDTNGNNTFEAGVDVNPQFEARGDSDGDPQGFASNKMGGFDNPAGGNLGNWFLRQPDGIGVLPGPFIIDYDVTQTINALSGEIWDIDATPSFTEQWRVDVLDSGGIVVATELSPLGILQSDPASLDSLPWAFSFTGLAALSSDVDKVRLTFVGTKTDGIGLSFNNFNAFEAAPTTAAPEPGSAVLFGLGLGALAMSARSRTRSARRRSGH